MPRALAAASPAVTLAMVALALAGCGGGDPVPVSPATSVVAGPSASSSACTRLLTRLPATLLGFRRSAALARGTAGWGAIVLRCGVVAPGPTTTGCIGANGIDWIFTEDAARYKFLTYGRTPAIEVTVPTSVERTRAPGAMTGLAAAIRPIPQAHPCL